MAAWEEEMDGGCDWLWRLLIEKAVDFGFLLSAGFLFTVYWQLVTARRQLLIAQFDSISRWVDRLGTSLAAFAGLMEQAKRALPSTSPEFRKSLGEALVMRSQEAWASTTGVQQAIIAASRFQSDRVALTLKRVIDDAQAVWDELRKLDPQKSEEQEPVRPIAEKLKPLGDDAVELYEAMGEELHLRRILRSALSDL